MVTASRHKIHRICISESEHDPLNNWYGPHLEDYCKQIDLPLVYRERKANLGEMMNDAMNASKTKYTMIVQDDWYLEHPCDLSPGINLMEKHPQIDIIRYSWPGETMITPKGDLEGWRKLDPKGMWPYGDDPHIRRDTFKKRFGPYYTGLRHGSSESDMVYRFGDRNAFVLLADKLYFGHCGEVSAVINDERERAIKR
jgi:hypothetical protein